MRSKDQTYQEIIEKAAELGYRYETNYHGCSQAVVAALQDAFGIGGPDILRASTAFAGGVVRRGIVCGALTGGLMMIGFLAGRDDLEMGDQYQRGMGFADELYRKFEEELGTTSCPNIQQEKFGKTFDLLTQEGRDAIHEAMAQNPEGCQAVTREAARLAAEVMVEILTQGPPLAKMLARGK